MCVCLHANHSGIKREAACKGMIQLLQVTGRLGGGSWLRASDGALAVSSRSLALAYPGAADAALRCADERDHLGNRMNGA